MVWNNQRRGGAGGGRGSNNSYGYSPGRTQYYGPSTTTGQSGRGGGQGRTAAGTPPYPQRSPINAQHTAPRTPQDQGPVLIRLSKSRDAGGTDSTTRGERNINQQEHLPHMEMAQVDATDNMNTLLRTLTRKGVLNLDLTDFDTPNSSDGKSALLTMVVTSIISLRPGMAESQLARIAAHAAVHSMRHLFSYLMEGERALDFVQSALISRPISLQQPLRLCPMDTPMLLENHGIREQLGQLRDLTPQELRSIISPFLQCFYPAHWQDLDQYIGQVRDEELINFISIPGALHTHLA